jgi:hypothetical protein
LFLFLEHKETKALFYHGGAVAALWYEKATKNGKEQKYARADNLVKKLNRTNDDNKQSRGYLSIVGNIKHYVSCRTTFFTQDGIQRILNMQKATQEIREAFDKTAKIHHPEEEENKAKEGKETAVKKTISRKRRRTNDPEHIIECSYDGCLRPIATSTSTLCTFHQEELKELQMEDQKMMMMTTTQQDPSWDPLGMMMMPLLKKVKMDQDKETKTKTVRWQCQVCTNEAAEGHLHCQDHLPASDTGNLSDSSPQLIFSIDPPKEEKIPLDVLEPSPIVVSAAAVVQAVPAPVPMAAKDTALSILQEQEATVAATVPMEDDTTMASGVVVLPSPQNFRCVDYKGQWPPSSAQKACQSEYKNTGRCEYHYKKIIGEPVVKSGRAHAHETRICHYPRCRKQPISDLVNYCGNDNHKIRPDNLGKRYCLTPLCMSILPPSPTSVLYCVLHDSNHRLRSATTTAAGRDACCIYDGECQEQVTNPSTSLLCDKHIQESKQRQEAINKAKQERKKEATAAVVIDEVAKLKAENEALKRQHQLSMDPEFAKLKLDFLNSVHAQAKLLVGLQLPDEFHNAVVEHMNATFEFVKEYAGRRL